VTGAADQLFGAYSSHQAFAAMVPETSAQAFGATKDVQVEHCWPLLGLVW
jgi:hypothetical protein